MLSIPADIDIRVTEELPPGKQSRFARRMGSIAPLKTTPLWQYPDITAISSGNAVSALASTRVRVCNELLYRSKLLKEWQERVSDRNLPVIDSEIIRTFEIAISIVSSGGAPSFQASGLILESVNADHLIATLRATYLFKNEIADWSDMLVLAKAALMAAGESVEDHLEGML